VAPRLSVGLSAHRWYGRDRFEQSLEMRDTQHAHGDTVRLYQRFSADDRYSGWGARGGLLYVHRSGLRLGLYVASPLSVRVRSNLEDEFEDELETGSDVYPTESYTDRYTLDIPASFGAGLAWSGGGLTLSGDVHYADPRSATYGEQPTAVMPHVASFRSEYRNVVRYHLGLEYRVPTSGLALRAGYYADPISYTGRAPDVQVEEERRFLCFGLGGVLEDMLVLDAAATVGAYRQVEGGREDDVRTLRVFASAGYRFGGR